MNNTGQFEVVRHGAAGGDPQRVICTAVREEPLVIRLAGQDEYVLMRTPGHDRELAVGFLFTEGIIEGATDIHMLAECVDNPDVMDVRTAPGGSAQPRRNLILSSSCGLCGRSDVRQMIAALPHVTRNAHVTAGALGRVAGGLRAGQPLFQATGATHAAALFSTVGELLVVREDVGRHNAVDKVIGWGLLRNALAGACGLYVSGRTSLELVVKCARAGLPVLASVSAPTATAIEAARTLGMTLCGFVRGDDVSVYSAPERVDPHAATATQDAADRG